MKLTEEINRIKEVMFESLQGEDKKEYFQDEMDEIERAAQDLSRDNKIETSVKEILNVFKKAKETKLDDKVWKKLENTESNEIKKGDTIVLTAIGSGWTWGSTILKWVK
jgi:3-oxoacyl-[acyl-carrier-protein] synthase-3